MKRRSLVALAVLAVLAPSAALAAPPPPELAAATTAYINALNAGDLDAISAATTGTFHAIESDGKHLTERQYLTQLAAHWLNASPASGKTSLGPAQLDGDTATVTVDTETYDRAFLAGTVYVEHDALRHLLTWKRGPDGVWLLDEDHITAAVHTIT